MKIGIVEQLGLLQFVGLPGTLASCVDAICAQLNEWHHRPYRTKTMPLDVRRIAFSPQGPRKLPSVEKGRMLFETICHDGPMTLLTSSAADGDNSLLHCISRQVRGGLLGFRAEDPRALYPMNQLFLLDNFETKRLIRVMKDDDGWDFFEQGQPLWFEDVRYYQSRNKKDRLTPQILAAYLEKTGYGSFERDFWIDERRDAVYIFDDGFTPWSGDE